jgi:deoxyribose-phosphate aldolase
MKNLLKKINAYNKIIDDSLISERIRSYQSKIYSDKEKINLIKLAVSLIDLTSLEGNDTEEKIINLCKKAIKPVEEENDFPHCAAVCVYPALLKCATKALKKSDVKLASVATGFPSGQYPLKIKLADVKYCLEKGVNEIDMVISRGEFLMGNYDYVYDEIRKVRKICKAAKKPVHLKVILETGELGNYENIWNASFIAMLAGADFIKTSTGKIPAAATLPNVYVMCEAIKDYHNITRIKVGIKVAGGIRTTEEAINYITLVKDLLGEEWLTPELFRIGASSLLNDLLVKYKELNSRT